MACKLSGPLYLSQGQDCLPAWPACLAPQGSAAGPAWTAAGENSGPGTWKRSVRAQHILEADSSSPARWTPPSRADKLLRFSLFPPSLGVRAGKRRGGKEQGKPKDLAAGRLLLGSCLGDKSPGGQQPHSSPRTCPLRPSPAASGPRRALAGQGTALREEMENAGCGTALRVTAFLSQAPFCRDLLETTGAAAGVATHSARGWSRQLPIPVRERHTGRMHLPRPRQASGASIPAGTTFPPAAGWNLNPRAE